MRKTEVFAVAAAAALMLAIAGGWVSSTNQVRATKPAAQIDPFQALVNANGPPTAHYADFSMVFN
jgi:hypothetical protein